MTSLPHFPAAELESFYFCRIQALSADMAKGALAPLVIRFCHWTPSGQFAPWIGFRSVLEEAQRDEANGKAKCPALIFGMHSPDSIPANDDTAVLDWPGAKYLRYDVDDVQLIAALKSCLDKCSQPLPSHLKPKQTPQAFLKLLSNVRHHFEGLKKAIKPRLVSHENIQEVKNLASYQARVPKMLTIGQEKDLERLKCYMPVSMDLAPEIKGLKHFEEALQVMHTQWHDLENLAGQLTDGEPTAAQAVLEGWQKVHLSCEILIQSLNLLEQAAKQKLENIK